MYRHVESGQWLLHAAGLIAGLFRKKTLTFQLENLSTRLRYGIKEELLDLVRLKGVGRVRARSLFDHGFKNLSALKHTSLDELAGIKQIGKALARDILTQATAGISV